MNHIYRLVWNSGLACFVVASEISRSSKKGGTKGNKKPLVLLTLAGTLALPWPSAVLAEVESAGAATNVYNSANGVPIVDIATANASGLSHNQFTNYNVDTKGLVLNNNSAKSGQGAVQSQLAGQVNPNLNLNNAASVILNEVVSANRSTLAGYTEVAGSKADVVVANPWGITCSGCGFINTDRVTLTTGAPTINGGVLSGFDVKQGDVLFNGTGADLSAQQMFDVVARSIKLDGQVNANDVMLVAGNNDWNYSNRTATASTATDAAPSYAIDSTMLGGMYAGRIQLISNEAGVGVRMLGDAAATADNFAITADGKIELRNNVSAETNIELTSTGTSVDAIFLSDASLTAKQDLTITANDGGATISGGVIKAGETLTSNLASLTDSATAATTTDNNKRFANTIDLNVTGAASIDDTAYGAANTLDITADSLTLGQGATDVYTQIGALSFSTSGNMVLNDASVIAANGLTLSSASGQISTLAGADQGLQAKTGDVEIIAGNGLNNAGIITADIGSLTIAADNTITNTGTLQGATVVALRDTSNTATENIINSGTILSDGALTVNARALTNSGILQGQSGDSDINIVSFNNDSNGKILLSMSDGSSTITVANTMSNSNVIHSGENLIITATYIDNSINSVLSSLGNLSILVDEFKNQGLVFATDHFAVGGTQTTGAEIATHLANITSSPGTPSFLKESAIFTNESEIRSTGSISIAARTFKNHASIDAASDIWIQTGIGGFFNEWSQVDKDATNARLYWDDATSISTSLNEPGKNGWKGFGIYTVDQYLYLFSEKIETDQRLTGCNDPGDPLCHLPTAPKIISGEDILISLNSGNGINSDNSLISAAANLEIKGTGTETFSNTPFALYKKDERRRWFALNTTCEFFGEDLCDSAGLVNGWFYGYAATDAQVDSAPVFSGTPAEDFPLLWGSGGQWAVSASGLGAASAAEYDKAKAAAHMKITSVSRTTATAKLAAGTFAPVGVNVVNSGAVVRDDSTPNLTDSPQSGITFTDLEVTLPTSPNGYFVPSIDPSSVYLIETNPLFAVGSSFGGSNYLAVQYGYDPELLQKRLGDANYEAELIRQQLITQTGSNFLAGYQNEIALLERLMDQGASEAKRLGLEWGKMPTVEQLANLKEDMVWMVEVTVQGETVLAPQVFLSQATKDSILSGAVIVANTINMDVESLSNTGGTIAATEDLSITSRNDITNTSGAIKGGDVALTSTEGSIVNRTFTQELGNSTNNETMIGQTASIESTGDLSLDANKDIRIIGADVSAEGNGALKAGQNIVVDTIVDKTTNTTYNEESIDTSKYLPDTMAFLPDIDTSTSTTTTTEKNIGSNLNFGNRLTVESGNDTTIAGSDVTVGGDLDVVTGGDFSVEARQDRVTTTTVEEKSGLGVGGGVVGTETTTTSNFEGTNSGSTLTVGGNVEVDSEGAFILQGSDMTVTGSGDINAKKGIQVLDGLDEERTTTSKVTQTFVKLETVKEGSDSSSSSSSDSDARGSGFTAEATAEAQANADASAESEHNLKLSETTVTTTESGRKTSVSSNLTFGGNLTATTEGTLTVQGSNVEAGGDVDLDAKNVEVLTGRNETWSNTDTTKLSVGFYEESEANAEAKAEANAEATTYGRLGASAEASADADADSTVTIGGRTERETSSESTLTNTSSSIKSGGTMNIVAEETATFVGANVESGGDMNIQATDIENKAAQDITHSTVDNESQTVGVYLNAQGEASGSAAADAKLTGGGFEGQLSASGEVGAGLRYANESDSSAESSSTNVTNTFKSGGNFTRTAEETIVDQGTQVDAAGNITQSATEIRDEAIYDTSNSSSESESHDARLGVYAGAEAEANVGASVGTRNSAPSADAGAEAAAGFTAKYEMDMEETSSNSSTAVTSKFKSGGNISSTSSEKTSLVGTEFDSAGDVAITAGSLDYQAAQDASSNEDSSHVVDVDGKVAIYGSAGIKLDAEYEGEDREGSSTTERGGAINAGGNIKITTTEGDATFVGTKITAEEQVLIDVAGDANFEAAKSTTTKDEIAGEAALDISATKGNKAGEGNKGIGIGGELIYVEGESEAAVVGTINSGEGGTVITSGGNANFEGTQLDSEGSTSIRATGDVNLQAAKDTLSETDLGFSIGLQNETDGPKLNNQGDTEGTLGGDVKYQDQATSTVTSVNSKGRVEILGANIVSQEANITSENADVETSDITNIDVENRDIKVGFDGEYKSDVDRGE